MTVGSGISQAYNRLADIPLVRGVKAKPTDRLRFS